MVSAAREVLGAGRHPLAAAAGMVRMSMPKALGRQLVHPLVPCRFWQRYPEVDVQLLITDRTVDLFEEQVDLAIRITDTPARGWRVDRWPCVCAI
jgi:DNA-binding transcriptional LysR family regulator